MYSPRIQPELIPVLYRIARDTKQPMTRLVDGFLREAIRHWKRKQERNQSHEDNSVNSPTSSERSVGV